MTNPWGEGATEEVKYKLTDPSEVGRTILHPWAVEEQVLCV